MITEAQKRASKKYYLQNKDMYNNNLKKWRLKNKGKIKMENILKYHQEKKELLDQFEKDVKQYLNKECGN